jgi:hypothetical protein
MRATSKSSIPQLEWTDWFLLNYQRYSFWEGESSELAADRKLYSGRSKKASFGFYYMGEWWNW